MNRTYQEVEQEVNKIVDGLGMPIDEHIKKAVTALRLWGFPTAASCQGHPDHGSPHPWVLIYAPEQEEQAWIAANMRERERLSKLLDQFYSTQKHHRSFEYVNIGAFGGFKIINKGAKMQTKTTANIAKEYREDFDALADFLIAELR